MPQPLNAETARRKLESHLRRVVRAYPLPCVELEWRLGHRAATGSFKAGVGAEDWLRLKKALEASRSFAAARQVSVERLSSESGHKLVSVVTPRPAESLVCKTRLADVDLDPAPADPWPWTVRASLSLERLVDPREAPSAASAPDALRFSRQKDRWSFRHKCWSVDLTRVRSNLPSCLDDDTDTFEVEIELADPEVLFERPLDSVVDWGWRLAGDMCELMLAPGRERES